ncbi:MAG: acireductone synthase [Pirellulaceae bacterium]
MNEKPFALQVQAIVVDIEGTVSSIQFVHEVMFPFASEAAERFLQDRWEDAEVQRAIDQMAKDWSGATSFSIPVDGGNWRWNPELPATGRPMAVAKWVRQLIADDSKTTGLKHLQGMIWKDGFHAGLLTAPLFSDVPPALQRWSNQGLQLAVYSSGSIAAQKLFFQHTSSGNLLSLFSHHFDTTTGGKRSSSSYRAIAERLKRDPSQLLFLSDVYEELTAAKEAGWQAIAVVRPGNAPLPPNFSIPAIESFDELSVSTAR